MIILQGTTPVIPVTVMAAWTGLNVHISFESGASTIIKKSEDNDFTPTVADGKTTFEVGLTQAETLSFNKEFGCDVQCRAFNADGSLAAGTDHAFIQVEDVIEPGVLRS